MKFGKLHLHSTSRMTLNDRFSNLPKNNKATVINSNAASRKNKRLAQQMANRPSVQQALQAQTKKGLQNPFGTVKSQPQVNQKQRGTLKGARGAVQVHGAVQVGAPLKRGGQNVQFRPVMGTPQSQLKNTNKKRNNKSGNPGQVVAHNVATTFVRSDGNGRGGVANKRQGVANNRQGVFANRKGGVANNRQGGVANNRQGGVASNRQGGFANNRLGGFANNRQGFVVNNRQGIANRRGGVANRGMNRANQGARQTVTSVKQRLSIQGRLSQPSPVKQNFNRGGFETQNSRNGNQRGLNNRKGSFRARLPGMGPH